MSVVSEKNAVPTFDTEGAGNDDAKSDSTPENVPARQIRGFRVGFRFFLYSGV